ncbi:MAG: ABC transporter ATP-binding protein, partial [Chitinophagia bacterium]|nr:ABC transporter ATP-binding protein [Chitinophagia bacterium]
MIVLAILLAAINQTFSLLDPYYAGQLLDQFVNHPHTIDKQGIHMRDLSQYMFGALTLIGLLIGVAMVSRIAKNFQDYVVNVVIQKF